MSESSDLAAFAEEIHLAVRLATRFNRHIQVSGTKEQKDRFNAYYDGASNPLPPKLLTDMLNGKTDKPSRDRVMSFVNAL